MSVVSTIPSNMFQALRQSLPEETPPDVFRIIEGYTNCLDGYIDLQIPAVLCQFLQDKESIGELYTIAQRIITPKINNQIVRYVGKDGNGGFVFPIQHELLASTMQRVKDKIVVVVGAASGEIPILLAAAGANKVFVNEIDAYEIGQFKKLLSRLPNAIQDKLVPVQGDCLNFLNQLPHLRQKVDVIYAGAVVHFFDAKQKTQFFNMTKTLLISHGLFIGTVNSTYSALNFRKTFETDPDVSSFVMSQCLLYDYDESIHQFIAQPHLDITPCPEQEMQSPSKYNKVILVKVGKTTRGKWQNDETAWASIGKAGEEIRKKIDCYIANPDVSSITNGSLVYLQNWTRIYTTNSWRAELENNGFEPEEVFVLGADGHILAEDDDPYGKGQLVGAIARAP